MVARLSAVLLASTLGLFTVAAPARAQAEDPFVGADACQPCHADIHAAWSKTKHQRALQGLSQADKSRAECIGCHITALPESVAAQAAAPLHPGVQCEACHGSGRGHAAGPPALAGMTAAPGERVCLQCHNDKSPTFKGFFFAGMKAFVHKP